MLGMDVGRDAPKPTPTEIRKKFDNDPYLAEQERITGLEQLGTLKDARWKWDLLPTAVHVQTAVDEHRSLVKAVAAVASCLQDAARQWTSNQGALKKAGQLEMKASEKEKAGQHVELNVTL